MTETGTCAVAKFVMKGKQNVAQVRAGSDGLILQQLLYADEVRAQSAIGIEKPDVQPAELKLAEQLIEQYRVDTYDPTQFKDEEKERLLAAIDQKIAGKKITLQPAAQPEGAEIIDLVEALRASLKGSGTVAAKQKPEAVSRIGVKAPGMIAVMAPVRSGVKRRFERPQECGFLLDFATAVSPFSGIGLGLRKLSPSMTMR
jgi:DNA end-binding protein Ku